MQIFSCTLPHNSSKGSSNQQTLIELQIQKKKEEEEVLKQQAILQEKAKQQQKMIEEAQAKHDELQRKIQEQTAL